jgi:hypothetical protein
MKLDNDKALKMARNVSVDDWATHIAVRNDLSKAEQCVWNDKANDYLDEDPSKSNNFAWACGYKHCYWTFFLISEVKKQKRMVM